MEEHDDNLCEVNKATLSSDYMDYLGFTELQERIYKSTIGCRLCDQSNPFVVPRIDRLNYTSTYIMSCEEIDKATEYYETHVDVRCPTAGQITIE